MNPRIKELIKGIEAEADNGNILAVVVNEEGYKGQIYIGGKAHILTRFISATAQENPEFIDHLLDAFEAIAEELRRLQNKRDNKDYLKHYDISSEEL